MSAVLEVEPRAPTLPFGDSDRHIVVPANWSTYERFLNARGADNHGLRLTFNRGKLEFMSISSKHDRSRYILRRIVDTVTEELNVPIVGQGETTIRRKDLDRGFEPDIWFYILNARRLAEIDRELDFEFDPAPDLAVEIEISRSLLDRIDLYAAIGLAEIWCYNGNALRILVLQPDRTYIERPSSVAISSLTSADLNLIINEALQEDSTSYFRRFRLWVRQHLVAARGDSSTVTA